MEIWKAGDSVMVREGLFDYEEERYDLSGWQGRILEVGEQYLQLAWDSITLRNMPPSYIEDAIIAGEDWTTYGLALEDAEPALPRDTLQEVDVVIDQLERTYEWTEVTDQQRRIRELTLGAERFQEALQLWYDHLDQVLELPFEARVHAAQKGRVRRGDEMQVMALDDMEDEKGILVLARWRGEKIRFPLSDLEALLRHTSNYEVVGDYAAWWIENHVQ